MINPIKHYSFETIPSVYDEEAMTALELCGRLGKKVNECITAVNGWNVPQLVHVSPTGDKTGELDRVVIQGKLDAGFAVQLAAGEYYLNGPLMFRAGYMLRGDSQLNTVLNCRASFIDHDKVVSVDHVQVRDIRVKGPEAGVGIDISRKVDGVETGGRYSEFMNVYLTGYDTGVRLGGCWCVSFRHCRIEAKEICFEQLGSCNHIKYDHCVILGPESKTSTGIKITAEDGAENYGIRIDHCDFERHATGVHAYYCVALNVFSLYAEGVSTMFKLDSCPAFLCDGGYISHPERVCNTSRSNTSKVFSKCTGTIRNIYVRVNSSETWYLISSAANFPVKVEMVDCVNDGSGECIVNTQHDHGLYNGHEFAHTQKAVSNITGTTFSIDTESDVANIGKASNFKVQKMEVVFPEGYTPSATVTITLSAWTPNGYKNIMTGYLNAGTRYDASLANRCTCSFSGESYRDLILAGGPEVLNVNLNSSDANLLKGKVLLTLVNETMIL